MKSIFGYMIAALLLAGCSRAVLSPGEYMAWVRDQQNGLNVEKEIGDHLFQLQYKPVAYEVLMQSKDENISGQDFNAMQKTIDELQYFTLTIIPADRMELATSGMADEDVYSERITYMMSDMQYDFALIEGADTLPCVFFHAERNFNLSPENHILLGFERPAISSEVIADKTIFYYDRILDCGPVMLTIKAADIENIPELKFAE